MAHEQAEADPGNKGGILDLGRTHNLHPFTALCTCESPAKISAMDRNAIVPEGQYTSIVYTAIKDARFAEAVHLLTSELGNFPRNRAALSLLSYCYYQMQDYKTATTMYEQLVKVCPSVEEYKVSHDCCWILNFEIEKTLYECFCVSVVGPSIDVDLLSSVVVVTM